MVKTVENKSINVKSRTTSFPKRVKEHLVGLRNIPRQPLPIKNIILFIYKIIIKAVRYTPFDNLINQLSLDYLFEEQNLIN